MSGQPNRYATSAEKFRNQYMDALNSRANVDDFNLQANKNYKATGSLPPSVMKMMDNRTTSEILADTEKLKLNIINELKVLMTTATGSVVVQKIQTAAVNADGSFLVWVAQNMPEIVRNLRKKYALGIKGDSQDAENIVLFLSDMYTKVKSYSGSVKAYFDANGDGRVGIKEGDLDAISKEYSGIVARIVSKYGSISDTETRDLAVELKNKITNLNSMLNTREYKNMITELNNLDVNNPTTDIDFLDTMVDNGRTFFDILDNLPSTAEVKTLMGQLTKSLDNSSPELSNKILLSLIEIFPSNEEYILLDDIISNYTSTSIPPPPPPPPPTSSFTPSSSSSSTPSSSSSSSTPSRSTSNDSFISYADDDEKLIAYKSTIQNRLDEIEAEREDIDQQVEDLGEKPTTTIGSKKWDRRANELDMRLDALDKEEDDLTKKLQNNTLPTTQQSGSADITFQQLQISQKNVDSITQMIQTKQRELDKAEKELKKIPISSRFISNEYPNKRQEIERIERDLKQLDDSLKQNEETIKDIQRRGVSLDRQPGVGLGFKKRRGRPKGSGVGPKPFMDKIDESKGIKPVKKYHPFGKYYVNSHKLNHGNVLSIKSKSGTNVREYPSRTVSPRLGSVIKTIIGGGVPTWNDMEKLSEDEKDYLYKVSKRAEFADKISIPTPSKDKIEKDIHEFEVCKGEIMAGNDSKELVKKFKLLVIKLSKNGTIPKREATEVMTELLELGY